MFDELETYVDSVFSRLPQNQEITKIKDEMREHLHATASKLQTEGHAQEECVAMAIDELGDVNRVQQGLIRVYGDNSRLESLNTVAWISVVVGIVSIVAAFIYPYAGVLASVIGVVFGIIARRAVNRRIAAGGSILSVVGLFTSAFVLLFSYISSVSH